MAEHVENPFLSYLKSMKDTLAQQRKTRSTWAGHTIDAQMGPIGPRPVQVPGPTLLLGG